MSARLAAPLIRLRALATATKTQFPGITHSVADHLDAAIELFNKSCDTAAAPRSAATCNLHLGWERSYLNSTHLLAEAVKRVQDSDAKPIRIEDHGPGYQPHSAADLDRFVLRQILKSTSGVGALARVK